MNYRDASERLTRNGKPIPRRKVTNNTYLERRDGDRIALRLHAIDVLTFAPDGTVTLDTGGWRTVTTKDRINYLDGIRVYSDRGRWFVTIPELRETLPYFDGIRLRSVIAPDGSAAYWQIDNPADAPDVHTQDAHNKAMRKRIAGYVRLYTDARIAELVAGAQGGNHRGDCLFCQMGTTDAPAKVPYYGGTLTPIPLGDATGDTGHLESHLEEGYTMVSTIVNAIRAKGYPNSAIILQFAPDRARDALTTYLRKRLLDGVAVR